MKNLIFILIITLISNVSLSNILQDYRRAKRDINTTKEILGIDKDSENSSDRHGTATFKEAIPGLLIIGIPIALIVFFSVRYSKKQKKLNKEKEEKRLIELKTKKKEFTDEINSLGVDKYSLSINGLDPKEAIESSKDISELNILYTKIKKILYLFNKYGEEIGLKLFHGQYFLGMTIEQLTDSRGKPSKIETEILKTKTKEIYIYGSKSSGDIFVFVDGTLERFKDR